jgi:CHAT domain-containing protein/Flp pilus assembly protein TadD
MTMHRPAAWMMAVALAGSGVQIQERELTALVPGTPIQVEGAPGSTLRHMIVSEAGQYLSIRVQNASEPLKLTLTAPDGKLAGQWVMWERSIRLAAVTATAGRYVLAAEQAWRRPQPFRCELLLDELRPASEGEARSVEARLALEDGRVAALPDTEAAFRDALVKYRRAVALYDGLGDLDGKADATHLVGACHFQIGETLAAIEAWKEALSLARAAGNRASEIGCLNSLAMAYRRLGSFDESLEALKAAFALNPAAGVSAANTLAGMGRLYSAFGEHRNALDALERTLAMIRADGKRPAGNDDQASIERNRFRERQTRLLIAAEHEQLGDGKRALDAYRTIITDFQGNAPALSEAYRSGGKLLTAMENYREALDWLERALALAPSSAMILSQLGTVYALLGEPARAIERLDESLKTMLPTENAANVGMLAILIEAGVAYAIAGQQEKALSCFVRGADAASAAGQLEYEARFLALLARAERDMDRLDEARSHIAQALAKRESIRNRLHSPDQRSRYFSTFRSYYDFEVDLLMQLDARRPGRGFGAAAFEASERARARSLLELLNEARIDVRGGIDEGLKREEWTLRMTLSEREVRRQDLAGRKRDRPSAEALAREIRDLTAEYDHLQARIRAAYPGYADLMQGAPLTLRETQRQVLDGETLLLEYMLGDEGSHLWALTDDSMSHVDLPARHVIEQLALKAYAEWVKGQVGKASASPGSPSRAASDLAAILLGPVQPLLGTRRVLVVPDGYLQYIPFGALPDPAGRQQPLVWNREVVHAPSASVLAVLRRAAGRSNPWSGDVAVLADPVFEQQDPRLRSIRSGVERTPMERGNREFEWSLAVSSIAQETGSPSRLPFSRREADTILSFVAPERALRAVDFRASRATAMSPELARYRIVHFATHGVVNDDHPGLSGLVLSLIDERGRPQDGFLRLGDIFNLNLPADLVVLSACRTALGKDVRGEGLMGLARGFMYAGAPRVVASQWKVDDAATAQLMSRFYEGLFKQNLAPASALRAAQVSLSKDPRWRDPFYWAGFVLQGEWR